MNLLCPWDPPVYLIFSSNIPVLLYYSHVVSIVGALIFGAVIFFKAGKELAVKIFIIDILLFSAWLIFDVLTWAANRVDIVLFYWGLTIVVEVLTYAVAFYFSYVFINKKDMPFNLKLLSVLLILPIMISLPTHFLLPGVDIATCNANENPIINLTFSYGVEIIFSLMILFVSLKAMIKKTAEEKKQIFVFLLGILIFLLAFSFGNIIGSITDDWNLAQYGLFGMPVFIGFLSYLVVKYKTFSVKVLSTQILVVALWLMTLSLLVVRTLTTEKYVVTATLILFTFLGYLLIRSVQREVESRERVEKLAGQLEEANKGQENLIHVMNHQIKGYLSKDRGVFSELLDDGEYGTLNDAGKTMVQQGFESATKGIDFVQDILKGSSAQMGTLPYNMQAIDFKKVVTDVVAGQKKNAEDKGLKFEFTTGAGDYSMTGDPTHLGEAVRNLIDNSINYTPSGSILLSLNRLGDRILFIVKDTGVGISDEDKTKLFTQGGRGKESAKINVNSTGYGLVFVKSVAVAHHGSVRAESLGTGTGSTFTMELPAAE